MSFFDDESYYERTPIRRPKPPHRWDRASVLVGFGIGCFTGSVTVVFGYLLGSL
jgi:hypothetical protein